MKTASAVFIRGACDDGSHVCFIGKPIGSGSIFRADINESTMLPRTGLHIVLTALYQTFTFTDLSRYIPQITDSSSHMIRSTSSFLAVFRHRNALAGCLTVHGEGQRVSDYLRYDLEKSYSHQVELVSCYWSGKQG
jgi:hypothetical protein